jgi:hypothetical protein
MRLIDDTHKEDEEEEGEGGHKPIPIQLGPFRECREEREDCLHREGGARHEHRVQPVHAYQRQQTLLLTSSYWVSMVHKPRNVPTVKEVCH